MKTLDSMNFAVMVDPGSLREPHNVFISGTDADARATVRALLTELGWSEVFDLGNIWHGQRNGAVSSVVAGDLEGAGYAALNVNIVRDRSVDRQRPAEAPLLERVRRRFPRT